MFDPFTLRQEVIAEFREAQQKGKEWPWTHFSPTRLGTGDVPPALTPAEEAAVQASREERKRKYHKVYSKKRWKRDMELRANWLINRKP